MTPASAISFATAPTASSRRGACPTLAQPMQTGDGLLARLRPLDCAVSVDQLRAIAEGARTFGNGVLEVTARGSLQARGLRPETVAAFEAAVIDSGFVPTSGVMVEVPPLSGIDPNEYLDARPLAVELRAAIEAHCPALALAPKLAIIIDGGGHFHLGDVSADIRLTALDAARLRLSVGATEATARFVAMVSLEGAVSAVLDLLRQLHTLGPTARGKGLDGKGGERPAVERPTVPVAGVHRLGHGGPSPVPPTILGLVLPYCQIRADQLTQLCAALDASGIHEVRLSPGHAILIPTPTADTAESLEQTARDIGFWTDPQEPRTAISLCAGNRGCASAHFETRAAAELMVTNASKLLDGSISVHLSGCSKGCAHPAPAELVLVGTPSGYGLVVNGAASDQPRQYIAPQDLGIAAERLASLVANAKEAHETVRDCLNRLGTDRISAALQLDGK